MEGSQGTENASFPPASRDIAALEALKGPRDSWIVEGSQPVATDHDVDEGEIT